MTHPTSVGMLMTASFHLSAAFAASYNCPARLGHSLTNEAIESADSPALVGVVDLENILDPDAPCLCPPCRAGFYLVLETFVPSHIVHCTPLSPPSCLFFGLRHLPCISRFASFLLLSPFSIPPFSSVHGGSKNTLFWGVYDL